MITLLSTINALSKPSNGFNIFERDGYIWGIGANGETLFGLNSSDSKISPIFQSTKYLKLYINHVFSCFIDGEQILKKLSLYVLVNTESKMQELFVRLCHSMTNNLNEEQMLRNFFDLKDLFTNRKKPSIIELQGMFGELFTIYYLKTNYGLDISTYYQKEEKRKFDFSISEKKKIEIKTTIKPERVHHFLHQQLDTDRFDIKIVSLMLQKDDCGMSLLDLINECKDVFSNYLLIILYIETMTKNIDDSNLDSIRFNIEYAKKYLKIFNGIDIPRIKEKDINGIFNIEYDVDLENVQSISKGKLIDWVTE